MMEQSVDDRRSWRGPAAVAALIVTLIATGCGDEPTPGSDDGDTAMPSDTGPADTGTSDTGPSDAGPDLDGGSDGDMETGDGGNDGGMCLAGGPARIDCEDRIERGVTIAWSARPGRSGVSFSGTDTSIFGDRGVRLEVDDGPDAGLVWEPTSPVDIRTDGGEPPVVRVAVQATNPHGYGWYAGTPEVTVHDADGEVVTLAPPVGFGERLPVDGTSWQWLNVPLAETDGWRLIAGDASSLESLDLSAIERVAFDFRSRGSVGFSVTLDGLAFTGPDSRCDYDCPDDCNGRGECAPSALRCHCEMGAVRSDCGRCGEGFEEAADGSCELAEDGDYDAWPNPVSDTSGDAWLRAHHQDIELLRPKMLVLNFANESSMAEVRQLVGEIAAGFETASTPAELGEGATPQLQYEIADVVDMRNGRAGHPEAPEEYPHENSTLWPRESTGDGEYRFNYAELFTDEFAEYYGYEDPDADGEYLELCELVERGHIHDLLVVGAHDESEAVPNEVLEYKQRYTEADNPIPGSFSPCAGNGCFSQKVSPCDRTVRIGFKNYKRGPGCYLHNTAHLMEWTHGHRVVPGFSRWFDRFASMDLAERHNLPVQSLYHVECDREQCITFPEPSTVEIRHEGETYTIDDWDAVCGNCHFPPNGVEDYDYDNETEVQTTCNGYGRRAVSCREDAASSVTQQAWEPLRSEVPDCGGGFLSWWYRRMPAQGTSHRYPSGEPMKSVWPYLFY